MHRSKLLLALLLSFLILALFLVSCGDAKNPGSTTPPPTTTTGKPVEQISITGDYVLVNAARSSTASSDSIFKLYEAMRLLTGANVSMKIDTSTAQAKEIILGDTSREESATARAAIAAATESDDTGVWVLMAIGEKLIVAGNNPTATQMAVDFLLENFLTSANGARFPEDLNVLQTYSISAHQEELDRLEQERLEAERDSSLEGVLNKLAKLPNSFGSRPNISQTYPTPTVYPSAGQHPRVMVNPEMKAGLAEKLKDPKASLAMQKLKEYVNIDPSTYNFGVLPDVTATSSKKYNCDETKLAYIEANAFYYMLTGEEVYGYRAILSIQNYINTLEIIELSDSYRRYGYCMLVAAEVYDWCYDLLTDKDKERIICGILNDVAPKTEVGFRRIVKQVQHQKRLQKENATLSIFLVLD